MFAFTQKSDPNYSVRKNIGGKGPLDVEPASVEHPVNAGADTRFHAYWWDKEAPVGTAIARRLPFRCGGLRL